AGPGKGGLRAGFPWWERIPQAPQPVPPRARRQCRSGRASAEVEELAPALHAAHPGHEQLEIRVALDEIEILGVDDQHRSGGVVVEEPRVALGEHRQIFFTDTALVASPAAPYPFYQRAGRRLQINNEVRHRRPRTQRLVDFLVQV